VTLWRGALLFLLAAALFLIANRGAYQGYFQDDEIDNLAWAPRVPPAGYARALLAPVYYPENFRPAAHFYFYLTGNAFGLDFPKYLILIHATHLLNVLLLWLLLRRLGADVFGASAGALFFAFHMAVFDVYWKPMYVFDLLCGTFSIACLLLYAHGRWLTALGAMWLAYKSKELAVMLPVVLAAYEWQLGKRRWKRLVPFFAISLLFGVQAVFLAPHQSGDYALRFTPGALWRTARFYEEKLLLLPFAGAAITLLAAFSRNRRVRFGLAAMLAFFVPLAFLPGRLYSAYMYVPLVGAAVAASALARRERAIAAAVFFALWLPWNLYHLRLNRRSALTIAEDNRRYITALGDYLRRSPSIETFLYDGRPFAFNVWGIEGAVRWFTGRNQVQVSDMGAADAGAKLESASVAVLSWDPASRSLAVMQRRPDLPEASFVRMERTTPIWQLGSGWYALENRYRWIEPRAHARLRRPPGAREFAVTVNINPELLRAAGPQRLEVRLNGHAAGAHEFRVHGWQTATWTLPEAPAGPVAVEFRVTPGYLPPNETRRLGVAIVSFGFPVQERS
jgi:hypothetical protein